MHPVLLAALARMRHRAAAARHELTADEIGLAGLAEEACRAWGCEPIEFFNAGAGLFPPLAVRTDRGLAVLKCGDGVAHQASVMQSAPGYASVFAVDPRGAMLTERLGSDASSFGDAARQALLLTSCLPHVWTAPRGVGQRLAEPKAASLLGILAALGPQYGADARPALDHAAALACALAGDPREEVVCHGDPHAHNLLRRPGGGWAFIDPDGFLGERSYDVGVTMRDFRREIEHAEVCDPGSSCLLLRRVCQRLAEATGEDPGRIWAWSCIERVTTGLYLRHLGYEHEGVQWLRAAHFVALADDGALGPR